MVKLLVAGWDGATFPHLERIKPELWDSMNNKGRLFPEQVYRGIPIDSGTAWTTITTGLEVEKHGFLSINNVVRSKRLLKWTKNISKLLPPGKMRTYLYYGLNKALNLKNRTPRSQDVGWKRLWDYIEDRTLTLGVPLTYPSWKHNGVMMSGIPAPLKGSMPTSYPEKYEKYRQKYSAYYYLDGKKTPLEGEDQPNLDEYVESVYRCNQNAFHAVEELAGEEEFELIFAVFPLIDDLLHVMDEEEDWEEIEKAYRKLDRMTRELIDKIEPDNTLIVSDHGMMPAEKSLNPNKYPGLKMDHDPMNGVWASDHDFDLKEQKDVTPAILELFGKKFSPERMEIEVRGEEMEEVSV
ncbi:MAG: alkaline phosphatase family protein [Candidatus Nanohaloarchaea archaeon]|nr:alkaline phosphatase family protein [Candidatus Nanohaloarchaea archaeon]